ncbi:MAG: polysaccharide biosynthesis protein [Verrucomicrobia bacterium]|nr:polysaccharide biosynthesis protein [Verrucomicrobiota bacterium]
MNLTKILSSRPLRTPVLALIYLGTLAASYWLGYQLRFDFGVPIEEWQKFGTNWSGILAFKLALLAGFGQFSGLLSYFSLPDLRRLSYACTLGSMTLLCVRYLAPEFYAAPRGVILLDYFFSLAGLTTVRLAFRIYRERYLAPQSRPSSRVRRVGIIGAGDVGASLARELLTKRGLGMQPIAFFDDDQDKWRSRVHDIPVVGAPEALLDQQLNLELEEVIIAMPSAPAKRIGEVVKILHQARLDFETVPSLDQLATGQVKVSQLRSVEIQDLLGRQPVNLNAENIRRILTQRVVMVTGAGGSIGSELCRQIAVFNPQRLLLVDQSEVQTFPIEQELIDSGYGGILLPLVADIRDADRMRFVFQRFRPVVLFHAAAHKHVPMMESQPGEAIRNNTLGTARLAELALEYGVDQFVMVSTDKAINPTNVMGATKRLAEIFIQSLHASLSVGQTSCLPVPAASCRQAEVLTDNSEIRNPQSKPDQSLFASAVTKRTADDTRRTEVAGSHEPKSRAGILPASALSASEEETGRLEACPTLGRTKFMAVRFGNVLGSSGSVIPIFNKQIAAGGPVKVTHPDVTRYFMTIPEAVGLVLQSAAQGVGGEIFVLDMGKPVKIVDLARQLIELSGLKAEEDIDIIFTGLRPGEKLFEELSYKGENITPTDHPKILRFVSEPQPLKEVRKHLDLLAAHLHDAEANQLKLMLKNAVPEYQPYPV